MWQTKNHKCKPWVLERSQEQPQNGRRTSGHEDYFWSLGSRDGREIRFEVEHKEQKQALC